MQAKITMKTNKLTDLREKIDQIDTKIADLLATRAETVRTIKIIKKQQKLPKIDPKREKEILSKLKTDYQKAVFKKILIESRKLKPKSKI